MSEVIGSGPGLDRIACSSASGRTKGNKGEQSPEGRGAMFWVEVQPGAPAGVLDGRPDGRARSDEEGALDEGSDEEAGQCDGPELDRRTDRRPDGGSPDSDDDGDDDKEDKEDEDEEVEDKEYEEDEELETPATVTTSITAPVTATTTAIGASTAAALHPHATTTTTVSLAPAVVSNTHTTVATTNQLVVIPFNRSTNGSPKKRKVTKPAGGTTKKPCTQGPETDKPRKAHAKAQPKQKKTTVVTARGAVSGGNGDGIGHHSDDVTTKAMENMCACERAACTLDALVTQIPPSS
ncbi:hypothetical protein K438DRAFT_1971771 [Mycena galopus ATCC 62051]|nr:hypothetical protein K438DRAFT_1971771 [Mycena galopus ATCC 62051]